MTYPIRNLKEATLRLNQYQMDDRPLNLQELRDLRDLLSQTLKEAGPLVQHLRMTNVRLRPDIALHLQNLERSIG